MSWSKISLLSFLLWRWLLRKRKLWLKSTSRFVIFTVTSSFITFLIRSQLLLNFKRIWVVTIFFNRGKFVINTIRRPTPKCENFEVILFLLLVTSSYCFHWSCLILLLFFENLNLLATKTDLVAWHDLKLYSDVAKFVFRQFFIFGNDAKTIFNLLLSRLRLNPTNNEVFMAEELLEMSKLFFLFYSFDNCVPYIVC